MRALALCALGVLGFSFTLPATRIASGELDPLILGPGRGAVAAVIAALVLLARAERRPTMTQWKRLSVVAGGVVLGFPLLTSLALTRVPTHHAVVLIGLTPLGTSICAALRNRERPSLAFWLFALLGALAVAAFGVAAHGFTFDIADFLLLLAVLLVSIGYAEGGKLAAELDGVSVVCWALLLALPFTLSCVAYALLMHPRALPGASAWLGFGYVSIVSSVLAFGAWYRGLALGGIARGSQVQLMQPVLSLLWCSTLLGEPLTKATMLAGGAVLVSAAGSRWTRA
ncbi:MAG: family transporter [Myxococcaceae bacterium]|nr:family transporter [Myxococcaceae bacterium]